MAFVSVAFAVFLSVVFALYWLLGHKRRQAQNLLLLTASFIFYGYWDWRFCFLLASSILLCYIGGIIMDLQTCRRRKIWLTGLICVQLSSLLYFKYCNFFIETFDLLLNDLGIKTSFVTLNIVLPLGVSFYTFHGLSYLFDVYNRKIHATRSLIDYGLFVSFFPLLVAGPIERATHLLPQIEYQRQFNYSCAMDGFRQMLWGFFKKIVIADNCAGYVDYIFSGYEHLQGSALALGALLFSIQIYADFSGYSDIAIGCAKLFGINLLRNFSYPCFVRDIAEFWRHWHISLTTWFRDYVYIPLGGSRRSKWNTVRNTLIIFLLCGFWHGANWTFLAWAFIHVLLFLPLILFKKNRRYTDTIAAGRLFPNLKEFIQMLTTGTLVCFTWIFFRAESVGTACNYIAEMFSAGLFELPNEPVLKRATLLAILGMFAAEWLQRTKEHALQFSRLSGWARGALCLVVLYAILWLSGEEQEFIYFQF
ncbi:MAG: MBOAT family protein [Prevotella sp.]|jgi:D-alanyl-lipoteichoic acid acyltransferase DltB (MBOAT superfamily)|nr:MBOAT family protein [Prevotella sp.]